MKIGIVTGGGGPGLNAVIRAAAKTVPNAAGGFSGLNRCRPLPS
jgi:6-phosphofructokinase